MFPFRYYAPRYFTQRYYTGPSTVGTGYKLNITTFRQRTIGVLIITRTDILQ